MTRLQEMKLIAEGSERDRLELQKQLDAQRLRADTAEANFNRCNGLYYECQKDRDTLRSDLAAAEQRIAELREILRLMTNEYACCLEAGYDRITFLGGECDSVSKMLAANVNYAKACDALNQKYEGESQ